MSQTGYVPFTVDHTQVPSSQTGFPVGIVGTFAALADTAHGGHAVVGNSGHDIRPYSDACVTALTYELVFYDPTTGQIEMWVKRDISSTADTPINLGAGDTTLTADGSSSATWDAHYQRVYHLKNGSSLTLADSTSNAGAFTDLSTAGSATATAGQIDGGVLLASATQASGAALQDETSLGPAVVTSGAGRTIEAWIQAIAFHATTLTYATPISTGYTTPGSLATTYPHDVLGMRWNDDGTMAAAYVDGFAGTVFTTPASSALSAGTWHHFTIVLSATSFDHYLDGAHVGSVAVSPAFTNPTYLMLSGQFNPGEAFFDCAIDEVRVSNIPRSADHIAINYANTKTGQTFVTSAGWTPLGGGVATAAIADYHRNHH